MQLAQTLFELGFITYHRTDSQRVSEAGINVAKEFIKDEFGIEEDFTGQLESFMDKVEEGTLDYKKVLDDLYEEILRTRKSSN